MIKFEMSHRRAHLSTDQMTKTKSFDGNKIESESDTESCFLISQENSADSRGENG